MEVCEALNALTPGDHDKRSALFNSGAEAVENAIKIARLATGRQAVVVFEHAYHGRTNLTMALTAKNMPYKDRFGPFAPEVYRVPTSYPFRRRRSTAHEAARRAIAQIETDVGASQRRGRPHRADPGRGWLHRPGGGLPPRARGVVRRQRARCSSPTRSRPGSAARARGSRASTRASSPTSSPRRRGSPPGCRSPAVTGRREVMDAVHEGGLGGTYGGNPIACAAALATIEIMRREDSVRGHAGSSPSCARASTRSRARRRSSARCAAAARCSRSSSSSPARPRRTPPR